MRLTGTLEEVDQRLRLIMQNIHRTCLDTAGKYGQPGNYVAGANIAAFVKVADAMIDQGSFKTGFWIHKTFHLITKLGIND